MKRKQFHTIAILLVSLLVITACSKKDREPTLVVNVQNAAGVSLEGATVHAWPTNRLSIDSTASGIPDPSMDQTAITNVSGEVIFEFPASAVLDLDVTYTLTTDTTPVELIGHRVVKIEVIEQKEEKNLFNEIVVVE